MEGDVILCIRNKKEHIITKETSIQYVNRKLLGVPRTTCVLSLLRSSVGDTPGGQVLQMTQSPACVCASGVDTRRYVTSVVLPARPFFPCSLKYLL